MYNGVIFAAADDDNNNNNNDDDDDNDNDNDRTNAQLDMQDKWYNDHHHEKHKYISQKQNSVS